MPESWATGYEGGEVNDLDLTDVALICAFAAFGWRIGTAAVDWVLIAVVAIAGWLVGRGK